MSGASHRTKANDVNENMNAKRKAEPIDVLNIGHQKYLARLNRVFPMGSKRIDSSNRGGIVAIFGSTKRMTRARLNQAWVVVDVVDVVDVDVVGVVDVGNVV